MCSSTRCRRSSAAGCWPSRRSARSGARSVAWREVGQTRTIVTADGGTLLETLTVGRATAPLRLRDHRRPRARCGRWSAGRGAVDLRAGRHRHPDHLAVGRDADARGPAGDAGLRADVARLRPAGPRGGRVGPAPLTATGGADWDRPGRRCYLFSSSGGCGAVGSASRSQREGQGFESPQLHPAPTARRSAGRSSFPGAWLRPCCAAGGVRRVDRASPCRAPPVGARAHALPRDWRRTTGGSSVACRTPPVGTRGRIAGRTPPVAVDRADPAGPQGTPGPAG